MANPVLLLRTGCLFKVVCPDCGKTIAKNLQSERDAFCNAGQVVKHQAACPGEKLTWFRQLVRAAN
jgi:hypothetical protein